MSPVLADEAKAVYDTTLQLARQELAPLTDRMDDEDWFAEPFWRRLASHGLLGAGIDEQWGGSGGTYMEAALVCEALARVSPAFALSFGAHVNLCAHNIARNGSDDQRARWLHLLCDGSAIGALALTEPEHGSDAMGLQLRAQRDGSGWRLTGRKTFITNAPIADVFVVYARTTAGSGSRGLTAFIVPADAAGLAVGTVFDKVGMRGSPTGELVFDDVRADSNCVLGEVDAGYRVIMSGLDVERAFMAFLGLGVAQECLSLSLEYARGREQFGQPIARFQLVQAMLADMYARLFCARAAAHEAMSLVKDGGRASGECAAALLVASESAVKTAEDAVQIHGGAGYMRDAPVQRFWRDAKLATIGAGTSEIRRLLIARELLGERGA